MIILNVLNGVVCLPKKHVGCDLFTKKAWCDLFTKKAWCVLVGDFSFIFYNLILRKCFFLLKKEKEKKESVLIILEFEMGHGTSVVSCMQCIELVKIMTYN